MDTLKMTKANSDETNWTTPLNEVGVLENVQEFAQGSFEKAKHMADNVITDVKKATRNLPQTIKNHPLESLVVGFGAGFLVAFVAGRLLSPSRK